MHDVEFVHLLWKNLDACFVALFDHFSGNRSSCFRGGSSDQIHEANHTDQMNFGTILGDFTVKSMLNGIPL